MGEGLLLLLLPSQCPHISSDQIRLSGEKKRIYCDHDPVLVLNTHTFNMHENFDFYILSSLDL